MRDHIRERDIEQALDITAGEVTVDVADDGTATVTIKRDHLDLLVNDRPDLHDECGEYTKDDMDDARADGYQDGRESARREYEKAEAAKTLQAKPGAA